MFEYYNNTLCVKGNWLVQSGVVTLESLKKMTQRGKVIRAKMGKGLDNHSLYYYSSLPERFKTIIEHDRKINPFGQRDTIRLSEYLSADEPARIYFANYELEDGRYLLEVNQEAVEKYTANVCVFNAIHKVIGKVTSVNPGINKAELWEKITDAVHNISGELRERYPFDLPFNSRALRAKYESCLLEKPGSRYPRTGLEGLIHDNYCNKHSAIITETIGKWLIVQYGMSVKKSIHELWLLFTSKTDRRADFRNSRKAQCRIT